jgi:hypothetical protein
MVKWLDILILSTTQTLGDDQNSWIKSASKKVNEVYYLNSVFMRMNLFIK